MEGNGTVLGCVLTALIEHVKQYVDYRVQTLVTSSNY